jgi:hypothetical protein
MFERPLRLVAIALSLMTALGPALLAQAVVSRRDAETMKQKIAAIVANDPRASKQMRRTTVSEAEVNAYLRYEAVGDLPPGVREPSVSALGPGRVSGRAVVDLDAVRRAGTSSGLLDPRSFLTGQVPVTATGMLRTSNGIGRFQLESASVGGVPIPKWLLQEIVSFYTKSADAPAGVGLDDGFELPAGIREIQVERGQALIVQ